MKKLLLTGILILGTLTACPAQPPKAATFTQFKQAATTPNANQVTVPIENLTAKLNFPTGLPTLLGASPINTIRAGYGGCESALIDAAVDDPLVCNTTKTIKTTTTKIIPKPNGIPCSVHGSK